MILEFMKQHRLAVISTVSPLSLPESAVVGIAVKDDFELHIATFAQSRKLFNIKQNSQVALVIGWEHGKTVQVEGRAEELTDPAEIKEIEWEELGNMPTVAKYIKKEHVVFLKIKPKWLKYSDFSTEPWQIEELRFI